MQLLRTREERSRMNAQSGNVFAYEWDPVTDVVVIPKEHALALGIAATTPVKGRDLLLRVHPDDRERLTKELAAFAPDYPYVRTSFHVVDPDRGIIRVETNCCAMFDGAGKIVRVIGIIADTTAHTLAEMEIAKANDRLHLAMDAGKTVGWDWDIRSGRDTLFGDLKTVFGIEGYTHIGHVEDFRRRVHPDDQAMVWHAVKQAMEGRTPYSAEFRIVREDGKIRWVAAQGRFLYRADGEPERMMGIEVDITDRKISEEALRRKEFELEQAQRLAQVGSWQWYPDRDKLIWSDELYRIAGRDRRQPPSVELSELYTAESCQRLRQALGEMLLNGTPFKLVLELVRPDRTTRWVIARGDIQHDSSGIVQINGTVQDVTEQRRIQEALRESEERLRLAAQAGRMYAFEWDRKSDIIVRSAEFTHILGTAGDSKNTTCQQMLNSVHPDDREKVVLATNECTPECPMSRVRYRVVRPDKSVVWLEKNGHAFFDEKGEMIRMIGMIADITDRKLAEEAISSMSRRLIEAQEAERSRIARDLHDDIGQRLAMLAVSLDQVKRILPDSDNNVRDRVDDLRQQVLDISTGIHALSHELHSSKLRHLDMVTAMRGFCMELSEQQKVDILFGYRDIPRIVPQDISICLFRVLQEALHNAVKHSNVHQFQVELLGTSGGVHLSIRDSGLGFDPQTALNGQGLGLTSMQERMKLVDGELSIESQPTRGTTIRARAPFPQVTSH
jgi:PAS domain S-box-containing protein